MSFWNGIGYTVSKRVNEYRVRLFRGAVRKGLFVEDIGS